MDRYRLFKDLFVFLHVWLTTCSLPGKDGNLLFESRKRIYMTELQKYIKKHEALFWYIPQEKKKNISNELLLETILNYGTMGDVKELISVMGFEKVFTIFFSLKGRKKNIYYPEIYNYFSLLFK